MCNFRVLAQNTDGYVVFCRDCRALQLAFGTVKLKMRPEYFQEMIYMVKQAALYRAATDPVHEKNIFIPLVDESVTLCLTFKELNKLEALLGEAMALFETYVILNQL